jgi:hypothetical protein
MSQKICFKCRTSIDILAIRCPACTDNPNLQIDDEAGKVILFFLYIAMVFGLILEKIGCIK